MTKLEIAEYIVKKDNCLGISCIGWGVFKNNGTECPLICNCNPGASQVHRRRLAEKYIEEHKKGCNKEQFESAKDIEYTIRGEWPETGFIVDAPRQPETPGYFTMIITARAEAVSE